MMDVACLVYNELKAKHCCVLQSINKQAPQSKERRDGTNKSTVNTRPYCDEALGLEDDASDWDWDQGETESSSMIPLIRW